MDPYDPAGRARAVARGREILALLAGAGTISPVERAAADDEIGRIALPWRAERPESSIQALLHFGEIVPPAERERSPLVRSTLDLEL